MEGKSSSPSRNHCPSLITLRPAASWIAMMISKKETKMEEISKAKTINIFETKITEILQTAIKEIILDP